MHYLKPRIINIALCDAKNLGSESKSITNNFHVPVRVRVYAHIFYKFFFCETSLNNFLSDDTCCLFSEDNASIIVGCTKSLLLFQASQVS